MNRSEVNCFITNNDKRQKVNLGELIPVHELCAWGHICGAMCDVSSGRAAHDTLRRDASELMPPCHMRERLGNGTAGREISDLSQTSGFMISGHTHTYVIRMRHQVYIHASYIIMRDLRGLLIPGT